MPLIPGHRLWEARLQSRASVKARIRRRARDGFVRGNGLWRDYGLDLRSSLRFLQLQVPPRERNQQRSPLVRRLRVEHGAHGAAEPHGFAVRREQSYREMTVARGRECVFQHSAENVPVVPMQEFFE